LRQEVNRQAKGLSSIHRANVFVAETVNMSGIRQFAIPAVAPDQPDSSWTRYAESEAMEFCQSRGIAADVSRAFHHVEQSFPSAVRFAVRVDTDPDEDGQWLAIDVSSRQDADTFLRDYNRCIALWAANLPTEVLTRIRLSYSLIE
jgi:hypothetical protein